MAIIDRVKLAARKKHNSLDSEIERQIEWARSEMERAGVPSRIAAADDNPQTTECVINGVLMHISTDERIRDAAEKAFLYELDNMRKSTWETEEDDGDYDS